MTDIEFNNIPTGLYKIWWKSGGCSLASIGQDSDGNRWLAPTNWTFPVQRGVGYASNIYAMESIKVSRNKILMLPELEGAVFK